MKVKELQSTVNVVWSPQNYNPVTLATGSAAQHVDSSFSSSAKLEFYSMNLGDPGYELEQKISIPSDNKFQKLVWSSSGILVGGCDGGLLQFYNVDSIFKNTDALVASNTKHTGSVSALDLNPFQNNLLSSGASESEIYIWDLNNTSTPMAPGNKSQPHENVQALAWNRQVQHILASTFSTRCVVWDLRKNEPIIKLSDGQARTRWKAAEWHPSVATQLCIASEDDQNPVIQLWDLRLATSPLLQLEGHHKGVLGLSWCQQDPDLLLSSGKDGRILCWNPNNNSAGGELLLEICSTGQWMYDVSWCPKNPNLISTCSNDGRVGIYSINGGAHNQPVATSNKIMDSFPGMETLHQQPVSSHAEAQPTPQVLPKPPQWTRRPIKACFGFGGKLITIDNQIQSATVQNGVIPPRQVFISQVTTDLELVAQATTLQEVVGAVNMEGAASLLSEHCRQRADQTSDQHERYVWHFLKASFEQDPRAEMLNLLGFRQDDMSNKINSQVAKLNAKNHNNIDGHVDQITERLSGLSRSESSETEAEPSTDTSTDISGVDGAAAFDNIAQANKTANNVDAKDSKPVVPFIIPTGDDPEGLICQALLSGNIEAAVELCMDSGRTADALVIASTGGSELLSRTQWRHLSQGKSAVSRLSSALLGGNWVALADTVAPSGWKATLAAALTHCSPDQLYAVCESLGEKLDREMDPALCRESVICYLCSASVEPLVSRWQQEMKGGVKGASAKTLTEVVELVLIARLAAMQRGRPIEASGKLSDLLTSYALRLASQGHLEGALNLLSGLQDQDLTYRLQCALGYAQPYVSSNRQTMQRPASNQNQWASGGRVRTSSYKSATQPQDSWGNNIPAAQPNYMQNQSPLYNQGLDNQIPPVANVGFNSQAQSLPPQQPPRPTSASSHSGLVGRNKYLRDPSVQSGGSSYHPSPIETQPGFGNRQNMMQPQQSSYSSPQVINTPFNTAQPSYSTAQPMYNSPQSYNQVQSGISVLSPPTMSQTNSVLNPISQTYPTAGNQADNLYNGAAKSGYYNNPEVGAEAIPPTYTPSAPGWNDPPMISAASKAQPKQDYSAQAPIVHPLFGTAAPSQHVPLTGPPQYAMDPMAGQQPPHIQNYGAMPPMQQQMPNVMLNQQANYQQAPVDNTPKLPPPPVQKAPIPEQHIHMQTVFDALRAQCAQSSTNPQIKRKLDDVQRKLETLYDMLRENRLSENAINTLHGVVQMIQVGDYNGSLAALMALASGPDFSSVASFLPSLKIMIQTASSLQIYLR